MDDSIIIDLFVQRKETAISESQAKYGVYCSIIANKSCILKRIPKNASMTHGFVHGTLSRHISRRDWAFSSVR